MHLRTFQSLLVPGDRGARPGTLPYTSAFGRWNDLASVRRRPLRQDPGAGWAEHLWFPPELYPVALHPLVTAKGEPAVRRLLLHRLQDYLSFTTELESFAVIPVATKISQGRSGLDLPEPMRADAYKIVTDEAWHAQFSYDFGRRLAALTCPAGPEPGADATPPFITRLDTLRERLPHDIRGVESLLFAVVSETLISGILADLPRDDRLPQQVRQVVRDHAEDEGRHHVYFRAVLRHLWGALTFRERGLVGPLVPAAIHAFLAPDYDRAALHLGEAGLSADEVGQVIEESWPAHEVRTGIADAARRLTGYFADSGALADGRTAAAFEEAGLLAGDRRTADHSAVGPAT